MQKIENVKDNLDKRLKRVEGQVKGIRRMIDEGKECQDVLTQVAAARSALKMVGNIMLNHYAAECLVKTSSARDKKTKVEELQNLIHIITRFVE